MRGRLAMTAVNKLYMLLLDPIFSVEVSLNLPQTG